MLIDAGDAVLYVVDVQERFLPAMHDAERLVAQCEKLLRAAGMLDLPVILSEQYPKGLGKTVAPLAGLAGEAPIVAKTQFSGFADPTIRHHLAGLGKTQVLLCGIEAHVCILQTAVGLKEAGYAPFVVADAVTSRAASSVDLALDRLRLNGVEVVTVEMVVFEMVRDAASELFKPLTGLIK